MCSQPFLLSPSQLISSPYWNQVNPKGCCTRRFGKCLCFSFQVDLQVATISKERNFWPFLFGDPEDHKKWGTLILTSQCIFLSLSDWHRIGIPRAILQAEVGTWYKLHTSKLNNWEHIPFWFIYIGVSKNNATPKSSILLGFSITFTIHFGGKNPTFGNIPFAPKKWKSTNGSLECRITNRSNRSQLLETLMNCGTLPYIRDAHLANHIQKYLYKQEDGSLRHYGVLFWGETPKGSFGKQALTRKLWLEFMVLSGEDQFDMENIQELSWFFLFNRNEPMNYEGIFP